MRVRVNIGGFCLPVSLRSQEMAANGNNSELKNRRTKTKTVVFSSLQSLPFAQSLVGKEYYHRYFDQEGVLYSMLVDGFRRSA